LNGTDLLCIIYVLNLKYVLYFSANISALAQKEPVNQLSNYGYARLQRLFINQASRRQ